MRWLKTLRGKGESVRAREGTVELHQEALRYFLRNQSSVGCYGGSERLDAALRAMDFFAYSELASLGELSSLREVNERLVRRDERMVERLTEALR